MKKTTMKKATKKKTAGAKQPASKRSSKAQGKDWRRKINIEVDVKAPPLSDEALDKLIADIVKVVDYDTFKAIFGPEPEVPEEAEGIKQEARDVARKHLKG